MVETARGGRGEHHSFRFWSKKIRAKRRRTGGGALRLRSRGHGSRGPHPRKLRRKSPLCAYGRHHGCKKYFRTVGERDMAFVDHRLMAAVNISTTLPTFPLLAFCVLHSRTIGCNSPAELPRGIHLPQEFTWSFRARRFLLEKGRSRRFRGVSFLAQHYSPAASIGLSVAKAKPPDKPKSYKHC